jgi:hypothetical protein
MATGRVLEFDPGSFFNVGKIADDAVGCLFGPVGCAISVAVAILLLSRSAHVIVSPQAQAFIQCILHCRQHKFRTQAEREGCMDACTKLLYPGSVLAEGPR